jgi:hypothetical protein
MYFAMFGALVGTEACGDVANNGMDVASGDVGVVDVGHDSASAMDTGMVESGVSDTGGNVIDVGIDAPAALDVLDESIVMDAGSSDEGAVDGGAVDAGGTATDASVTMCPPLQHVCRCATGYYCVGAGAMCISPSAPCP